MGQGRALNPEQYCIIATDVLGNGWSFLPSNSPEQPGTEFPRFTLRDMVASQYKLLEVLRIEEIFCVIGASMGGMQALHWAAMHSNMVQRIVAMTSQARTSAWSQLAKHSHEEFLCRIPTRSRDLLVMTAESFGVG